MHDFYLAKDILGEVLRAAKKNRLKKISRIVLRLGEFMEHNEKILPQNLRQNFKLLAKNTLATKAKLVIKKTKIPNQWCLKEIEGR